MVFLFLKVLGTKVCLLCNCTFAFKTPMFEKESAIWSQEFTMPGRTNMLNIQCHHIFDSIGTLNFVTTGHESSKSV